MEFCNEKIKGELEKQLIGLRREFHKYPEEGWMEYKTTIDIVEYLKRLGLAVWYGKSIHSHRMGMPKDSIIEKNKKAFIDEYKEYDCKKYDEVLDGYTGAVAVLDTKCEGNTTVLRFDIDGLPIEESKCEDHKPYIEGFASKHQGYMHACGHDCHIAMGLTIAKYLCENVDKLAGKIIFIFQPAEEGVRGAYSLCNSKIVSDILKHCHYFLSSHIGFCAENMEIGCSTTGFLGTEKMNVEFSGVSSHAGVAPEDGRNALMAACALTSNVYNLTQNGKGISRANVGKLISGSSRNTIPDKAELEMEIRASKKIILDDLKEKVENMIKGASLMYGVNYDKIVVGSADSFEYLNKDFTLKVEEVVKEMNLKPIYNCDFGASEDVTYFMNKVSESGGIASYFVIGTKRKFSHHSPKFDIDESNLINGVMLYVNILHSITNKKQAI